MYTCNFNSCRDIERVVPDLAVDIGEIMSTGVVASTGETTPYTKETEVSEVGHYITDKIQAAVSLMNMNKSMSAVSKSNTSTSAPAEPKAE